LESGSKITFLLPNGVGERGFQLIFRLRKEGEGHVTTSHGKKKKKGGGYVRTFPEREIGQRMRRDIRKKSELVY